jgi:Helix-turn-helix domain
MSPFRVSGSQEVWCGGDVDEHAGVFGRLEVLLRVQSGRLRIEDACAVIGLCRRQVFRLVRGLKQDGATSLVSRRRGRPSNHPRSRS